MQTSLLLTDTRRTQLRQLLLLVLAAIVMLVWRTGTAQAASTIQLPVSLGESVLQGDGDDDGDDDIKIYGRIDSMPPSGLQGTWVISGTTYTTSESTVFLTEDGPFAVGRCVEVESKIETPTVASKIATESDDQCTGGGDDGGGDDDGDDDSDDNDIEVYGRIEVMPTVGLTGTWTISGTTWTADNDTEFETEHGAFAVGVCVEVEALSATPTIAEKIETESSYKCNGSDDDDDGSQEFEGEFYGQIVALPAGPTFLGDWTVGSITFEVTTTTELKQEDGPFAVGGTVKVHFREDGGNKIAREVETVIKSDDDDDDDEDGDGEDDDGIRDGEDGHAFGPIVSFPAGLTGPWNIAGVLYTANDKTEFDEEDDSSPAFAVGVNVKVEYYEAADGTLIATEIEITDDRGEVSEPDRFKFVGYVTAKPAGFLGTWEVNGEPFVADGSTEFDEEKSLLTLGAYVEVKYRIVGEQRIISEIEVEVPPGAGGDDDFGKIDQGGDDSSLLGAAAVSGTTWRIGGVNYSITAATDLVNTQGPLTLGSTAFVNSYVDAFGAHIATRVQGFTVAGTIYLPFAQR